MPGPPTTSSHQSQSTQKPTSRQYICRSLAKKRRIPIWRWGEDIFLRESDGKTTYFYCWLCEKQKRHQEIMVVSKWRRTALDHLTEDHNMHRTTGKLQQRRPTDSNQPTIEEYPLQWSQRLCLNHLLLLRILGALASIRNLMRLRALR